MIANEFFDLDTILHLTELGVRVNTTHVQGVEQHNVLKIESFDFRKVLNLFSSSNPNQKITISSQIDAYLRGTAKKILRSENFIRLVNEQSKLNQEARKSIFDELENIKSTIPNYNAREKSLVLFFRKYGIEKSNDHMNKNAVRLWETLSGDFITYNIYEEAQGVLLHLFEQITSLTVEEVDSATPKSMLEFFMTLSHFIARYIHGQEVIEDIKSSMINLESIGWDCDISSFDAVSLGKFVEAIRKNKNILFEDRVMSTSSNFEISGANYPLTLLSGESIVYKKDSIEPLRDIDDKRKAELIRNTHFYKDLKNEVTLEVNHSRDDQKKLVEVWEELVEQGDPYFMLVHALAEIDRFEESSYDVCEILIDCITKRNSNIRLSSHAIELLEKGFVSEFHNTPNAKQSWYAMIEKFKNGDFSENTGLLLGIEKELRKRKLLTEEKEKKEKEEKHEISFAALSEIGF